MHRYLIPVALLAACAGGDEPVEPAGVTAPVVVTDPAETAASHQAIEAVIEVPSEGPGTIEYEYRWISGDLNWTQPVLPASTTTRGETWVVTVTPYAGDESGPSATASVTITNGEPTLSGAVFAPATPTIGQELRCVPDATDPDGDVLDFTFSWTLDGSDAGETSDTLAAENVASGVIIGCTVSASDGEFTTDDVTITGTADNGPPVVLSASISPASPASTQSATCVPGTATDPDNDPVTFTYGWTINDADAGEASDTLDASRYVRDDRLVCTAFPTDGVATGAGAESAPAIVGNGPPVVSAVELLPENPVAADTVECIPTASDPDNDQLTYSYRWLVNGSPVGETSGLLVPGLVSYQDNLVCEVTAFDGEATATNSSPSVAVGNTPPTVSGIAITPSTADATSALSCSHTSTFDQDGHDVSVSYSWAVNGNFAGSGSTLAAGNAIRDQTVQCQATPFDGTEDGIPASTEIVLVNAAPRQPNVTVSPTTPTEADDITCMAAATDPDGDSLNYSFTWFVEDTQVATTAVLTAGSVQRGQLARCEAVASDGDLTGPTGSLSLTPGNQFPVITDVEITPASALAGDLLTCTVTADDPDGDTLTTSYAWTRNGDPIGIDSATLDGRAYAYVYGDSIVCTATVDDTISQVSADSAAISVDNSPPFLGGATITPADGNTSQVLTCQGFGGDDADGHSVNVRFLWLVNGSDAGVGATLPAYTAARGQTVQCTAIPSDGIDDGTPEFASIDITNAPPAAPSVTVGPLGAHGGNSLTCVAASTDPDLDSLTYEYEWFVGTTSIGTGDTLAPGSASRDQQVRCEARAWDGAVFGAAGMASMTLSNEPPVITDLAISPSPTAGPDATITCEVTATDGDDDDLIISYEWLLNGGSTGIDTYTYTGNLDVDDTLICRATATDGELSDTQTSTSILINNSLPVVTGVAISPALPVFGTAELTCTHASTDDADGQTVQLGYAWIIDNATVGTDRTLAGGIAKDTDVTCEVTPYDGIQYGVVQSDTVRVQNTPPVLASVSITPANAAYETTEFTCLPGTSRDDDTDTIQTRYRWLNWGVAISGATSATLNGDDFNRGDKISCEATPFDGTDTGDLQVSTEVVISNSGPAGGTISLGPTPAYETTELICDASGAVDPDGDGTLYDYAWFSSGNPIANATTRRLDGDSFNKGESIHCEAAPNDGLTYGITLVSDPVVIQNSVPTGGNATIGPTDPTEASTVGCSASGSTDADGEDVTYTWAWLVNDQPVNGVTTNTLGNEHYRRDDRITCTALPTDEAGATGALLTSGEIKVVNAAPTAGTVTLSPSPAYEESVIDCSVTAGTDLDGDEVTYTYTWYVGGNQVPDEFGTTLTGEHYTRGQTVTCRVVPNDTFDNGSSKSAQVLILNTAPTAGSVAIAPGSPTTLTDLTCTPSGFDDVDDNDTVSYFYDWTKDGSSVGTANLLDESNFVKGDKLECSVRGSDGQLSTGTVSTSVTVIDTAPVMGATTVFWNSRFNLFSCGGTATDPDVTDGVDTMTYSYNWQYKRLVLDSWGRSYSTATTVTPGSTGYYRCYKRGLAGGVYTAWSYSPAYYWDGGIILKSSFVELLGSALIEVERVHFESSLEASCEVMVDVDVFNPDTQRWEAVFSDSTDTREVDIAGAFAIDEDATYRLSTEVAGCEDDVFELGLDNEWHELTKSQPELSGDLGGR